MIKLSPKRLKKKANEKAESWQIINKAYSGVHIPAHFYRELGPLLLATKKSIGAFFEMPFSPLSRIKIVDILSLASLICYM